jgi:hypothetical protein
MTTTIHVTSVINLNNLTMFQMYGMYFFKKKFQHEELGYTITQSWLYF